jgi:hypothetical protein
MSPIATMARGHDGARFDGEMTESAQGPALAHDRVAADHRHPELRREQLEQVLGPKTDVAGAVLRRRQRGGRRTVGLRQQRAPEERGR